MVAPSLEEIMGGKQNGHMRSHEDSSLRRTGSSSAVLRNSSKHLPGLEPKAQLQRGGPGFDSRSRIDHSALTARPVGASDVSVRVNDNGTGQNGTAAGAGPRGRQGENSDSSSARSASRSASRSLSQSRSKSRGGRSGLRKGSRKGSRRGSRKGASSRGGRGKRGDGNDRGYSDDGSGSDEDGDDGGGGADGIAGGGARGKPEARAPVPSAAPTPAPPPALAPAPAPAKTVAGGAGGKKVDDGAGAEGEEGDGEEEKKGFVEGLQTPKGTYIVLLSSLLAFTIACAVFLFFGLPRSSARLVALVAWTGVAALSFFRGVSIDRANWLGTKGARGGGYDAAYRVSVARHVVVLCALYVLVAAAAGIVVATTSDGDGSAVTEGGDLAGYSSYSNGGSYLYDYDSGAFTYGYSDGGDGANETTVYTNFFFATAGSREAFAAAASHPRGSLFFEGRVFRAATPASLWRERNPWLESMGCSLAEDDTVSRAAVMGAGVTLGRKCFVLASGRAIGADTGAEYTEGVCDDALVSCPKETAVVAPGVDVNPFTRSARAKASRQSRDGTSSTTDVNDAIWQSLSRGPYTDPPTVAPRVWYPGIDIATAIASPRVAAWGTTLFVTAVPTAHGAEGSTTAFPTICATTPVRVHDGWRVADLDADPGALAIATREPWQGLSLVYADGTCVDRTGIRGACGSSVLLRVGAYVAVRGARCDAQVLLVRDEAAVGGYGVGPGPGGSGADASDGGVVTGAAGADIMLGLGLGGAVAASQAVVRYPLERFAGTASLPASRWGLADLLADNDGDDNFEPEALFNASVAGVTYVDESAGGGGWGRVAARRRGPTVRSAAAARRVASHITPARAADARAAEAAVAAALAEIAAQRPARRNSELESIPLLLARDHSSDATTEELDLTATVPPATAPLALRRIVGDRARITAVLVSEIWRTTCRAVPGTTRPFSVPLSLSLSRTNLGLYVISPRPETALLGVMTTSSSSSSSSSSTSSSSVSSATVQVTGGFIMHAFSFAPASSPFGPESPGSGSVEEVKNFGSDRDVARGALSKLASAVASLSSTSMPTSLAADATLSAMLDFDHWVDVVTAIVLKGGCASGDLLLWHTRPASLSSSSTSSEAGHFFAMPWRAREDIPEELTLPGPAGVCGADRFDGRTGGIDAALHNPLHRAIAGSNLVRVLLRGAIGATFLERVVEKVSFLAGAQDAALGSRWADTSRARFEPAVVDALLATDPTVREADAALVATSAGRAALAAALSAASSVPSAAAADVLGSQGAGNGNATAAGNATAVGATLPLPWPVEMLLTRAAPSTVAPDTLGCTLVVRWRDVVANGHIDAVNDGGVRYRVEVRDGRNFTGAFAADPARIVAADGIAVHNATMSNVTLAAGERYFVRVLSYTPRGRTAGVAPVPSASYYVRSSDGAVTPGVSSFVAPAGCDPLGVAGAAVSATPAPGTGTGTGSATPTPTPGQPPATIYPYAQISSDMSVVVDGLEFAAIDGTAAAPDPEPAATLDEPLARCQASYFAVPLGGWSVANATSEVIGAARAMLLGTRFTFGTDCVVFADGTALSTRDGADCSVPGTNGGTPYSDQLRVVAPSSGSAANAATTGFRPMSCSMRVLVVRRAPAGYPPLIIADPTAPSRTLEVQGVKIYATLDGAAPDDPLTTGCQGEGRALPQGWALAEDTAEVRERAIIGRTWGTSCVVVAGGNGYDATGAQCAFSDAGELGQSSGIGVAMYAPTVCPRRVLMSSDPDEIPCDPECVDGRGECLRFQGVCSCFPGFAGDTCAADDPLYVAFPNPSFAILDAGDASLAEDWTAFGLGYTLSAEGESYSGRGRAIRMSSTDASESRGARWGIELSQVPAGTQKVTLSAWSKATDVTGERGNDYAIYIDTVRTSSGFEWNGFTFERGTTEWNQGTVVLDNFSDISSVNFILIFRSTTGSVEFSDLSVTAE